MDIDTICALLIEALREASYNESTVFNYQGVIRRFKVFCRGNSVTEYTPAFGKTYADDVISKKTGKFSTNRYHTQGRFIRLIDSYFITGHFDFSTLARGKVIPINSYHRNIYTEYGAFLRTEYFNKNTIHFYEYGFYYLLQYLDDLGMDDIKSLTSEIVIRYIQNSKQCRQREILCELRAVFRYLKREDLLLALAGIHAPRIKRIIPTLTDEEQHDLKSIIDAGEVTLRDSAIVLLGLTSGIRACDLIALKLSDIDWLNETISFRQSKTGNMVCLPLTPLVGNAIVRYITKERPDAENDFLFVRQLAPFDPFTDHASCYAVVKRVFNKAGIKKEGRIFGMHMLRHNAASTMVKNSVPIETIAAILGHSSPDTTDIYITTDEYRLKECVLPMTGISTEVNP
ncbi:Tyrosine recombinase XerD [Clostridium sp. C105KSO15]|nr:Tyrosine recombinase XerD [Clostridium sp. C105KSO15]